ncbi:MAG: hypothetical protein II837_06015 [Treponema sp.]|nr:hypothetical protein [Treponema sp.]MBQ7167403.1 hypothetical protein [Treponema sp.]
MHGQSCGAHEDGRTKRGLARRKSGLDLEALLAETRRLQSKLLAMAVPYNG